MRSKALWGYDAAFLARCRALLTLTPAYIRRHRVLVADEAGRAVGVGALTDEGDFVDLDFMFVEPERTRAQGAPNALIPGRTLPVLEVLF